MVRDHHGRCIFEFENRTFALDILSSEVMATYDGLCVLVSHKFTNATIFSNSRIAIDMLCNYGGNTSSLLYLCSKL